MENKENKIGYRGDIFDINRSKGLSKTEVLRKRIGLLKQSIAEIDYKIFKLETGKAISGANTDKQKIKVKQIRVAGKEIQNLRDERFNAIAELTKVENELKQRTNQPIRSYGCLKCDATFKSEREAQDHFMTCRG